MPSPKLLSVRLTLAIRAPETTPVRIWRREVERPYPGVPRPGDWIYLGDTDDGAGLFAMPISLVTWNNDGTITLTFDAHDSAQAAQMEAFGFSLGQ
jgi:hypothetical protein